MDTGLIRPVSPAAEAAPTRPVDAAASAVPDVALAQAVHTASESALGDGDSRRESFDDRADITASQNVRKALAVDDQTHMTVVRKISDPGDVVIDQIPSEAYLRMRVALQETLDAAATRTQNGLMREA